MSAGWGRIGPGTVWVITGLLGMVGCARTEPKPVAPRPVPVRLEKPAVVAPAARPRVELPDYAVAAKEQIAREQAEELRKRAGEVAIPATSVKK